MCVVAVSFIYGPPGFMIINQFLTKKYFNNPNSIYQLNNNQLV